MKLKKRYFLLIILATLGLFQLNRFGDYCSGLSNVFGFLGFSVLFGISFLGIILYNQHCISKEKESFDYISLIIFTTFSILMFALFISDDKYYFKNKVQVFSTLETYDLSIVTLTLFDDDTFEFKTVFIEYGCTKKGEYLFEKDSLFLKLNNRDLKEKLLSDAYSYNKKDSLLSPKNSDLPSFKLH